MHVSFLLKMSPVNKAFLTYRQKNESTEGETEIVETTMRARERE